MCIHGPLSLRAKIEDFRYFYQVIKENYPFLAVKARTDGYDWASHRNEYEGWVRGSAGDEGFARVMKRLVTLLNNGHTHISPGGEVRNYDYGPWKEEVAKTTVDRADYWAHLAGFDFAPVPKRSTLPFQALYCAGSYVVVGVSPDKRCKDVDVGWSVVSLDGVPVCEYVRGKYGEKWLGYDPLRGCNFEKFLSLEANRSAPTVEVAFETLEKGVTVLDVPLRVDAWGPGYSWPPRYQGEEGALCTPNLYATTIGGAAGYVQIRSMLSEPKEDMQVLKQFMGAAGALPYLIIDIRGNGGGNDRYWHSLLASLTPETVSSDIHIAWRSGSFVKKFVDARFGHLDLPRVPKEQVVVSASCRKGRLPPEILTEDYDDPVSFTLPIVPEESVNYRGRVFLLVDDAVFSSSESFAAFCKGSGWATLVGTFTGGDGIGMDPALVTLPNSGLVVRFPIILGMNPDWSANEEFHTRPHVLAELSPWDLRNYLLASSAGLKGPDPSWDGVLRKCLLAMA